jgi:hemerythrin superfamily protein
MQYQLSIRDEKANGELISEQQIAFAQQTVTVKDIIEARVSQEVQKYNDTLPEYFRGLIAPTEAEQTLNGYRVKNRKDIDTEKQVYTALDAFQKNGFFVLVDNQQYSKLEDKVTLHEHTIVSFIKLTPLVGG